MQTFILASISVDGYIAVDDERPSIEWTSREDKKYFVRTTKAAKVMLMGSTTLKTIGRVLPDRQTIVLSSRSKQELVAAYQLQGNLDDLRVYNQSAREVLAMLASEGCEHVAICGGTSIYTQCMAENVVDEVQLVVEPVVFGHGKRLFSELLPGQKLQLRSSEKLSEQGTLLLIYSVTR